MVELTSSPDLFGLSVNNVGEGLCLVKDLGELYRPSRKVTTRYSVVVATI